MSARAVFLWHLHQPEYRDPQSGQPLLPWVRLHATRAYTDMAAALERHERVRCAVNWAPSLLLQLEAYVSGAATDLDEQLARRPVESLSDGERAHVLRQSFSVDWDLWVKTVPRYWELLQKRGAELKRVDLGQVQAQFTEQELRDVQVHFLLGWMGFAARREEPLVAELIARERGFTENDKLSIIDLQRRIASRILPRWRAVAARGQVELTCSPLFHPILPLLVDSDHARRAMPQAALPPRFAHPDDASEQIRRGLDVAERVFGRRPQGMWPSEGSVSPEVLELFAKEGVRWIATDEGILARSELPSDNEALPKGLAPQHRTYRSGPDGKVAVFFRDRDVSDAIGFRYARGDPQAAAQDLLRRISLGGGDGCITVALDGENPWEHYPRSGETFLDAFYGLCERQEEVELVLPRDELRSHPPRARISRIHSGSWIDQNYRIWIGHPEDNAAWTLLGEARKALDLHGAAAGAEAAGKAREALFAAEGSDWFWWYGDDFTTENAPEFDALFRRWVAAAYRHLKLPPPEKLSIPIIAAHKDVAHAAAVVQEPRRLIAPHIDGYHVGYYEWAGAGLYRPPQTGVSMYRGAAPFTQLLWGFSHTELFVRLDPSAGAELRGEVRVHLSSARGEHQARLALVPGGAASEVRDESGALCGTGRTGAIVELALQLERLGLSPGDELRLWVRVLKDDVEVDRLPRYAELKCAVPGREFEPKNWQV